MTLTDLNDARTMLPKLAVRMSVDLLEDLFTEGNRVDNILKCISGLPKGARFVHSAHDFDNSSIVFFFAHPDFWDRPGITTIDVIWDTKKATE